MLSLNHKAFWDLWTIQRIPSSVLPGLFCKERGGCSSQLGLPYPCSQPPLFSYFLFVHNIAKPLCSSKAWCVSSFYSLSEQNGPCHRERSLSYKVLFMPVLWPEQGLCGLTCLMVCKKKKKKEKKKRAGFCLRKIKVYIFWNLICKDLRVYHIWHRKRQMLIKKKFTCILCDF